MAVYAVTLLCGRRLAARRSLARHVGDGQRRTGRGLPSLEEIRTQLTRPAAEAVAALAPRRR